MNYVEKIHNQIRDCEKTTGKRPDSLWLEENDYRSFMTDCVSEFMRSPENRLRYRENLRMEPEDFKFEGIPVKKLEIVRYT